ncbi:hypothetical protein HS088_TW15G00604 [Tripterygium wilfordii]|uniref:PH domain-containing protein n=1 Tax=Tripterygium wilfordii TaxID=458696 RepID=A0A7J7CM30_TRIWF|nr:hypothetical protein HS088_TW15G00604 [Tripterygium wilfordii]
MTIDGVKRTAQQQVNKALKHHARFLLDLDIAAPKITVPTNFCPDNIHSTKLLLDLGNLVIRSRDNEQNLLAEKDLYLQFDLVLSDVSAFLVDGDYHWSQTSLDVSAASAHLSGVSFLPVIDKCGVIIKLQQIRLENPSSPSTRLAVRLPSLGFHFSPARYHRLMQVAKVFQDENSEKLDLIQPWKQADFEGWLSRLARKGVGNREAVWQRRYLCLVGPFLYVLESPDAKSYKQCLSLRGKQIYQLPAELVGDGEHVLAVSDAARTTNKVVEDVNALILRCDSDDSRRIWQSRLQGAIYHASGSAPITSLSETSSDTEEFVTEPADNYDELDNLKMEKVFITGVLDELKVCLGYHQHDQSLMNVLLATESRLCELRAIGGQVEVSIRANEMFIGTILKSLELEDLVCGSPASRPCYLARSYIRIADAHLSSDDSGNQIFDCDDSTPSEGDDRFYEASENLSDSVDHTNQSPRITYEFSSSRDQLPLENMSFKTPSFSRVAGLLPVDAFRIKGEGELTDTFDSFVKAQICIFDRNSPLYNNIDMRVTVTLATLSFFCRRPTILAIMEFVNAINVDDESCESSTDNSSAAVVKHDVSGVDDQQLKPLEEPVGLLGKGKSRVVFNLTLNMVRAQILLMNENETVLATLSQDNLLTDIKVFPSSFSIKAALGNLRISDNSLPSSHIYFWVCDMRNPGGSSFVELVFTSFSDDDEDYEGYDYNLIGQLSEVRIVYLNRFVQEVVSYFMGLVPNDAKSAVKLRDQVTNSEKWFTTSEVEGSPAIKLDLSLKKPIILMPRRTDSSDYLKLDVVHITVQNTFRWLCGSRGDMNAVHLEILRIMVEDINLNVGTGTELGESIIQDVKGVSLVIQRSLRDLLHQIPDVEALITIEELKAALSSREYRIITECALSNISETPHTVPPLNHGYLTSSVDTIELAAPQDLVGVESETSEREAWTTVKVSVDVNLVEFSLFTGVERDASLATLQVTGAWLLYKSNSRGDGFLSATLKGFTVFDDREGIEQEFRLAIGKPENIGYGVIRDDESQHKADASVRKENEGEPISTMLILDAKFGQYETFVSLCVQRPQLLVALDFLLAVVEFFVPTVSGMLSNEEDKNSKHIVDGIIIDQPTYLQPSAEISLSPLRPLIVDDERFDHFVYDGRDGILHLRNRRGLDLTAPSSEAIIFVANGKRLQFKNVTIKNGKYLDSCIFLGTNSSYSVSKDDRVHLDGGDEEASLEPARGSSNDFPSQNTVVERSIEFIIELQAIGPELTFYNTSKDVGESSLLSNQLLHAQLDAFGRLVLKGDTIEMTANILDLTMESNGIRILEPLDTSIKYSNASGKMNIHFSVSDIFMNFSFSILRLFLAVEEDLLAFLRMTSKQMTVVCSEFDKVGTITNPFSDQIYAFWRARAPPGFAVLGDYVTPMDKPPTKGVHAVNTSFARVKRPLSFKLIWPPNNVPDQGLSSSNLSRNGDPGKEESFCSIWFPEAPRGYVALGCVVSQGRKQPSLSSTFCILASLISPCPLRDCITIQTTNQYPSALAFWRVDNSVGTFLPADPMTFSLIGKAYELRHMIFAYAEDSSKASVSSPVRASLSGQAENSAAANSGRHFEAVATFQLIWWNRGSNSRKKVSIWRPVVPQGMVYFGDCAVKGYEPPNTCIAFHDLGDEELLKAPLDFQLVGQIKKQRGTESISFWMPLAPPGFVSLGCIACKGSPKQYDFSKLRCMRSDMVTGDQFLEESVWDTSDAKTTTEPFSLWAVGNELGTFIVRCGFKKPPRRFALKLADTSLASGSDDTVVDAEIRTFSAALFDDYGGLMVPLFNVSFSGIGFSLHGKTDYLNSTVSFSLAARSYNDKYETWEPLVEPVDGFLGYQYDLSAPGATSQLRLTSTRDLNLNVSVSNANMVIQAYASWNNLNRVHEQYNKRESFSPSHAGRSIIDVHHKRNYYIVPQNKLGQDIFIRTSEMEGLSNIIRMPSGDMKPVKVPVLKNMVDSHLKGKFCRKVRTMVTIIIVDAQFPRVRGLSSNQYTVAIRLNPNRNILGVSLLHQQSARTCGSISQDSSSELELIKWNENFSFKIDNPESYMLELIVSDMGKGEAVGFFSAPLNGMARNVQSSLVQYDYLNNLTWIELSSEKSVNATQGDKFQGSAGRLRCAAFLSPASEVDDENDSFVGGRKSGFIQISPSMEGPWTTVRLNYAAPAACWRFGNDVIAGEVSLNDGNRYVNIRSLVSVKNNTDFILNLRLVSKASNVNKYPLNDASMPEGSHIDENSIQTDEFFETEKYYPSVGWAAVSVQPWQTYSGGRVSYEANGVELPTGWEWIDDWHLDTSSVNSDDDWVYAPDIESLKWPDSFDNLKFGNHARQRRWIRNRKPILANENLEINVGILKPGNSLPLPLSGLTQSTPYVLQLRPSNVGGPEEYSWSDVVDKPTQSEDRGKPGGHSEVCISHLTESVELLCCTQTSGTSSSSSHKLWYYISIQPTEIAKDVHSDPIHDWSIVVKSPLSVTNYLPLPAEFSVFEMQASGHFVACSRGVIHPGKTSKVYEADIRNPLFLSLFPQRGWLPIHEAVLISHPQRTPSKTISLRSSISGRIVQVILEQNYDEEKPFLAKVIRVYASYWLEIARCPPLTFRFIGENYAQKVAFPFQSKKNNEVIHEEITEEEIYEGRTIASALNFNLLSLCVSITQSGGERFGPAKDLSSLGDMDGSLDLYAYDADGNGMRLCISTKPCPYQSVPTKVISVRPFMTFTNRIGQDIYIKLNSEDIPKVLHASDSRISFVNREAAATDKLQVRLEHTEWSFPLQITKEDTISLVLRRHDGTRMFLRAEIRGYQEGSRFIVVFRLGSANGPMRIENRTMNKTISIRQSGFSDNTWIQLEPLSTTSFTWEDPYGQKSIDATIVSGCHTQVFKLDLETTGLCLLEEGELGVQFLVTKIGPIKVARFTDCRMLPSCSHGQGKSSVSTGNWAGSYMQSEMQTNSTPLELVVELGVFGISVVDHRPKELSYLYFERVFISYSTGYDCGRTSRFKLILGRLQIDNQLPLTIMPVLLAPEQIPDLQHSVFKMTITTRNEKIDSVQVYPYVYIRVTDKCWRINIHEPIIWTLVDFYNNLRLDRVPHSSSVTQVDPEIQIDLIDVSEVRLKVSLVTAPAQRPHGVLGMWSPILSAVGNAFKIQVHLRRVMHRNRFMRRSSILPAIGNRIWRDLIHNPLHLIFSVDVLGMTSSTLASLSKGFAELSTDGQFLQLRSKQVWSRRITGVGDGIIQGTEALAQGVAFGVSGMVRKPVESARQNGLLGLAHGLGHAFVGFIVQPVSGALDFFSLTVDGIGASCSKFLEFLNNKTTFQRIRNPRTIHADGVLREYCEREAIGQMILHLAEASRHFGCTEIFKEPSKFALSDYYEEYFIVPYQRIVLVTNKRVMLLQCPAPDKMDKKPCKIMWDVPWQELLAIELAKAGCQQPSHLILHLKNFRRSENFVRVIKCSVEEALEGREPQAIKICSVVHKMYVSIGDIAHVGSHPPNVAAVYGYIDGLFAVPVGYDLVWRNCLDDYITPVSIWHPRAPEGFVSPGCVAIAGFEEPETNLVYCVAESLEEETEFEEQKVWSAPDSYPWACHIYQVHSDALHFVALRQLKEESDWKPMRVRDDPQAQPSLSSGSQ